MGHHTRGANAKRVILAMIESQPITSDDVDLLLDWFDKVRTGLWLGFLYLNGNIQDITRKSYKYL